MASDNASVRDYDGPVLRVGGVSQIPLVEEPATPVLFACASWLVVWNCVISLIRGGKMSGGLWGRGSPTAWTVGRDVVHRARESDALAKRRAAL